MPEVPHFSSGDPQKTYKIPHNTWAEEPQNGLYWKAGGCKDKRELGVMSPIYPPP